MADIFNFYVYDDRSIRFELAEPIMLEDKDVTQFRFRIPKSLNGFDMTSWEWWFIFVNPKGTKYTTLLELSDDEDEPDEYSVATYTVGYGFSGIVGTVRFSIEALNVSGEEIVNEWHTRTYSTTVTDTLQGHRAIIPEPEGQSSTGITEEVKQALLQIARKVAYIDEHGQTYYNALYDALYAVLSVNISPSSITLNAIGNTSQLTAATVPYGANVTWTSSNPSVATVSDSGLVTSVAWGSATITATAGNKTATCSVMVAQASVVAITADYTQSGTVYTTASLDDLKSDLTVSAEWSDGSSTTETVTDYTLSGTLAVGTSTITVTYGGKNASFNVTVSETPEVGVRYKFTGTDCTTATTQTVGGANITFKNAPTLETDGVLIAKNNYMLIENADNWFANDWTMEIVFEPRLDSDALGNPSDSVLLDAKYGNLADGTSSTAGQVIKVFNPRDKGFIAYSGTNSAVDIRPYNNTECTVKVQYSATNGGALYFNGTQAITFNERISIPSNKNIYFNAFNKSASTFAHVLKSLKIKEGVV